MFGQFSQALGGKGGRDGDVLERRRELATVLHQVARTAGNFMLLVKWHPWCVSEPQPPKRRRVGARMGHESPLAESIGHLLLTSSCTPSRASNRTYALAEKRRAMPPANIAGPT